MKNSKVWIIIISQSHINGTEKQKANEESRRNV